MTETTIDQFFSPTHVRKRHRTFSSPGCADDNTSVTMASGKVGDLTMAQLMEGIKGLLDEKMSTLATKDDLNNIITKVDALAEENRVLKAEVNALKCQERIVLNKLLDLEGRSRRNNLIFRGLSCVGKNPDCRETVRRFCSETLGHDRIWINRAHFLGKDRKAIIAHIPDDADIDYIMMQAKQRLRGTNFTIHRDFPAEVRMKRSRLTAVRVEVERVSGKMLRMPIFYDHLTIHGCRFTWEDGRLMSGTQDGVEKLSELLNHDFSGLYDLLQRQQHSLHQQRSHPASQQQRQFPAVTGQGEQFSRGASAPPPATGTVRTKNLTYAATVSTPQTSD